jgi:hypothetical protein
LRSERKPEDQEVITALKILACWGAGSVAFGLWVGPMLRLATVDLDDSIAGFDGLKAPDANGVPEVLEPTRC